MADLDTVVRTRVRRLLPTVDVEIATQRSVLDLLQHDLGITLTEAHRNLVKEEIDAYLLEMEDRAGGAGGGAGGARARPAPAAEDAPAAKRQKAAAAAPAPAPPPATDAGPSAADGGEWSLQLSLLRRVSVRSFKGRPLVDVREFYEAPDGGGEKPSAKGLAMSPDAWRALCAGAAALGAALAAGDDAAPPLELGGAAKRACVSVHKGRAAVDLREWYQKGGQWLPTKKGIALPAEQWDKLLAARAGVDVALAGLGGGGGGGGGGGASPAAPAAAPAADNGGAGPSGAAAAAPAASVELSADRRAEVTEWKGVKYLNIREFYTKDGAQLPGRKGLSLPRDQAAALAAAAPALGAALVARDARAPPVTLSSKRRATVNEFKGSYSVDLREWYEKDGEARPGQKGIALPPEQWAKLAAALPALLAAMG